VGKDQRQHLEMTRDIAASFNHRMGQEVFVLPEAAIEENLMTIPGTDGRKMSKSYNNYINIFLPDKELKKVIMSIQTDSTPLEAPKNPDTCIVFAIFRAVNHAYPDRIEDLKAKYLAGNFGYGHAKNLLLDTIHANFDEIRSRFNTLMKDPAGIENQLLRGRDRARETGSKVLTRVRKALGLRTN
jgi:tryptophanyl-tRNA synthetase